MTVWNNYCSRQYTHKKSVWMKINIHSVKAKSQKWQHKKAKAERKSAKELTFAIFEPLSYCFKETIGFDVKASFTSRPVSCLIRWYNKPRDITTESWEKAIQIYETFHGLKITNCKQLRILLENSAEGIGTRRECCSGVMHLW